MNTANITRRAILKGGLILGGAALMGIRFTHKAVAATKSLKDYMMARITSVYNADMSFPVRCSQDNKQVQAMYKNFLGGPGSATSHKLLHTHFTDRSQYIKKLRDAGKLENPSVAEFAGQPYPYE